MRNKKTLDEQLDRKAWTQSIAERIDCPRILGAFSPMNLCPAGTVIPIAFIGSVDPLPTAVPGGNAAPNGSQFLARDWYIKAVCGTNDLDIRIVRYDNGAYFTDPLTKKILDFDNPSTRISDRPASQDICSAYFIPGPLPYRLVSMSIDTLQLFAASVLPNGQVQSMPLTNCLGQIGLNATLDDMPMPPYWRIGGTNASTGPMSNTATTRLTELQAMFPGASLDPNLQPTGVMPGEGQSLCHAACQKKFSYSGGDILICNPNVSTSPPFQSFNWDQPYGQVLCRCLK
jgi:hypothetical protein